MKKIIFLALIPVLLWSFKEPDILKWYSLKEGLELARQENKPMLIFIYATWCDQSKRMEKKVFNSKDILPLLSENFILIKLNPEVDTAYLHNDKTLNRKVFLKEAEPGKFQLGVPTTVLYREKGNDRLVMDGVQEPGEFKESINKFLKK